MEKYKFINYSNVKINSLINKKRLIKAAYSIEMPLTPRTGERESHRRFKSHNLKSFKHIQKFNVSLASLSDYFKLFKTLRLFRKRLGTLVITENNFTPYDKEDEKTSLKLLSQIQKRVSTVSSFVLNSRTVGTINQLRKLTQLTILLDEIEENYSFMELVNKTSRLNQLKSVKVVSQSPEKVSMILDKFEDSEVTKRCASVFGVVIPNWNGLSQQPLHIKALLNKRELKFLSIVCHEGLTSLAQVFDLDEEERPDLEFLKLKIYPPLGGFLNEWDPFLPPKIDILKSLNNLKSLKKIELVITPRGTFGQNSTSNLKHLLSSIVFPRDIEEISLRIQEILLDEGVKLDEIISSLSKILSPLNRLKSLQLILLFGGELTSFLEPSFASLFSSIKSLQNLQFTIKELMHGTRKIFNFGDFFVLLNSNRNLRSIELEIPCANMSGLTKLQKNLFPNLQKFSLRSVGNIGAIVPEGGDEIIYLLNNFSFEKLEVLNLDFSCEIGLPNIPKLIETIDKFRKIREFRIRMLWQDYSLVNTLLKALNNKSHLKKLILEFPSWKAGPKAPKAFFEAFRSGIHEDIEQFKFLSRSFSALKTPKRIGDSIYK